MSVSASVVEWNVHVDRERLILTIRTPEEDLVTLDFPSGRNPVFRLSDLPGRIAPDGVYVYELRVEPRISAEVKRRLKEARARDDDAAVARIRKEAGLTATLVQSGAFSAVGGAFVVSNGPEPGSGSGSTAAGLRTSTDAAARPLRPVVNDQVIPDDLIVQASICAGFDCVDNESFGADTLKLKENNLRIFFDDTSTSAGFPSNDWRLVGNGQTSGTLNAFWIEDATAARSLLTLEAAAPSNSIYLRNNGNLGLGTANAGLDLQMTTSDTPAVRFEQTSAGGFTAQTWDIGANEANFFIRDLTGGSRLSFRIRPGAPTSSIDINAEGFVGFGTASPKKRMHVLGGDGSVSVFPTLGAADLAVFENNANANVAIIAGATGTSLLRFVRNGSTTMNGWLGYEHPTETLLIGSNSTERIRINSLGYIGIGVSTVSFPIHHSNGGYLSAGGAWTNASSRDYKQDVTELTTEAALDTVRHLKPVTYAYKVDPEEQYVGFIAEDVPDLVATDNRKGLSAMDVVAVLTKVVQEQQKTIDDLKSRLDTLEQKP